MAHPSDPKLCSPKSVRCGLVSVALFLVFIVVGRPVIWHSRNNLNAQALCPPCDCDCSSDILSMPLGFINGSFSDCANSDPEMNEEMQKDTIALLSEEINLHKNVSEDNLRRTMGLITEAKRTSSHYQKEAEKCTLGMETCEEAREKSVAALSLERKLSSLWEERAREHGWQDDGSL